MRINIGLLTMFLALTTCECIKISVILLGIAILLLLPAIKGGKYEESN